MSGRNTAQLVGFIRMTPPVIHVIALGLALVSTVALSVTWFSRPTLRRTIAAVAIGLLFSLLIGPIGMHYCHEGNALHQWAVPAVCATVATHFVRRQALRFAAIGGLAVLAAYLSADFAAVVHRAEYVGRAAPPSRVAGSIGVPEWFTPLTGFYRRGVKRPPLDPKAALEFDTSTTDGG